MLIGGVIGNVVKDDLDMALMRLRKQCIEVAESSEHWVYSCIVTDIVSEVEHWGWVDRRKPDGIDAKPREIVEF